MANTLTVLAPTLFSAAQEVSAEPIGVVDSIDSRFDNKGVAIGDKVTVPVAPLRSAGTYTPSMNPNNGAAGTDAIASSVEVEITANEMVTWHLTGEQEKSLMNGGNDREWFRQMAAQAMRSLRNKVDTAAAVAVKQGASRAVGTAGTTPLLTSLADLVAVRKILRANGAPGIDMHFVGNLDTEANLLNLGIIQQAYAAGTDAERRAGRIGRQMGFTIKTSAWLEQHVKGTLTSTTSDLLATAAIGTTSINCDTNTSDGNTVKAGDIITWAGDANKYVIGTAIASAAADMAVVLNRPGLRQTLATGVLGTLGASYTPNLAFERSAIVGIMRPPAIPASPIIEQMAITDQFGLTYLLCRVIGDGMVTYRVHLAYGFKVVQPEHVALLLG